MSRTDKTLVGVSIFNAVSAIGGGISLVTGTLPVPKDLLRHTPFDSYVIPGLFLGVVIGGGALVGAVALLTRAKRSRLISLAAGVLMVGWITGETILIQGFSWLQGLYLLTGLLVAVGSWYLPVDHSPQPPDGKTSDVVTPVGPTHRELRVEIADVAHDIPAFLTAPLYRRWHLHWGATANEMTTPLPGDDLQPRAQYKTTRAITIQAPPAAVWPWLVQVGCGRAGFYSNDLLDNRARPSATTILAHLQQLEVGQWVPMSPSATPTDKTAFTVRAFKAERWLLWVKPDSTWVWQLTSTEDNGTRLVTRIHATYDWHHPLSAILGVALMELGDFAMLRRMLRGIKARAESHGHEASQPMPRRGNPHLEPGLAFATPPRRKIERMQRADSMDQ